MQQRDTSGRFGMGLLSCMNMATEEKIEDWEVGEWVDVTEDNPETINSEVFESFIWRNREDSEKYNAGQLIVVFRNTGAYTYNVPKVAFLQMAERAYKQDSYDQTPFEVYDSKMIEWVTEERRQAAEEDNKHLYVNKLRINK